MSQCAAQVFGNIPPDKWLSLQQKAAANNIALTGNSGETTQQGFTFRETLIKVCDFHWDSV